MERNEAIKLGLNKYDTGRACRHGHHSQRYAMSGTCCECISDAQKSTRLGYKKSELSINFKDNSEEIYIIIDPRFIDYVATTLSCYCGLMDPRFSVELFRNNIRFKNSYSPNSHRYVMRAPIGQATTVLKMAADLLNTPESNAEMDRVLEEGRLARERYVRQVEQEELVRPSDKLT